MDELLTKKEIKEHLDNHTLRIAFIGMSNAGKSYRSKILKRDMDFMWYEVDQEISNKLGLKDVTEVAEWMGKPGDEDYEVKEAEYADKEEECTYLKDLDTQGKNLVFDTTGSVIYLSDEAKAWLREQCLVINLDTGEDAIPKMLARYMEHPKPVSWDGFLTREGGESESGAIKRCYPLLLRDRLKKYREFANINIPASDVYDKSAEETLEVIKSYLK